VEIMMGVLEEEACVAGGCGDGEAPTLGDARGARRADCSAGEGMEATTAGSAVGGDKKVLPSKNLACSGSTAHSAIPDCKGILTNARFTARSFRIAAYVPILATATVV